MNINIFARIFTLHTFIVEENILFKNSIFFRFIHTVIWIFVINYLAVWNLNTETNISIFFLIFTCSFVWQYAVLHTFVNLVSKTWRGWVIYLNETIPLVIFLDRALLIKQCNFLFIIPGNITDDMIWNIAWLLFSCIMMIGAICTRKEFERYKAL
jgi:hypothetical protein